MNTPSDDAQRRGAARNRMLLILLLLLLLWVGTAPLRSRLNRETARIEQETLLVTKAMNTGKQLKSQEESARLQLAANPQDFPARMALASALAQQRKFSEALANLQAAEQIDPSSAAPHAALGQLYDQARLPDRAIDELQKAVAMNPRDNASLTLLAYKYVASGWNRQAEELLTRALARQPDDAHLHTTLALVYFQTGRAGLAEQHLLTARRLAPQDPAIIGPLIEVYRNAQRYDDALKTIDEAMRVLPDKLVLLMEKAQVYEEKGQPEEAIAAADEVLQRSPPPPPIRALYVRAVAEKMKGDTQAAVRDFEQVRAAQPLTEKTLLLLGQLYLQNGQPAKGKTLLEEYNRNQAVNDRVVHLTIRVGAEPNNWKCHLELGAYYLRGGSYERAIIELKRTLELAPGQQEALRMLVAALNAAHRQSEAAEFASRLPAS